MFTRIPFTFTVAGRGLDPNAGRARGEAVEGEVLLGDDHAREDRGDRDAIVIVDADASGSAAGPRAGDALNAPAAPMRAARGRRGAGVDAVVDAPLDVDASRLTRRVRVAQQADEARRVPAAAAACLHAA